VYIATNVENQVLTSIRAGDIGFAASKLKKMKIGRKFFTEMVHASIDSENPEIFKHLVWSYYQFWSQELFEDAVKFATVNRKYQYLPYIDEMIDRINESGDRKPDLKKDAGNADIPKTGISGIIERIFKRNK